MKELRDILLMIYGTEEKVDLWLNARGPLTDPKAEAEALRKWLAHRPVDWIASKGA